MQYVLQLNLGLRNAAQNVYRLICPHLNELPGISVN